MENNNTDSSITAITKKNIDDITEKDKFIDINYCINNDTHDITNKKIKYYYPENFYTREFIEKCEEYPMNNNNNISINLSYPKLHFHDFESIKTRNNINHIIVNNFINSRITNKSGDNSFNFDKIKKYFGTMKPSIFIDFYMLLNKITDVNDMIKIINSIFNLIEDIKNNKERNFGTFFITDSIYHIVENYLIKTNEFIAYQNSITS